MTEVITTDRMLQVLEQVVEEAGEGYVYKKGTAASGVEGVHQCLYVHRGNLGTLSPGCIAGRVMHKLGVPLAFLATQEGKDAEFALSRSGLVTSERARVVLHAAQTIQDKGYTYGKALQAAQQAAERLRNGMGRWEVLTQVEHLDYQPSDA